MKLEFEYGQGLLGAELPDSTDIFIPGADGSGSALSRPRAGTALYAATLDSPSATPSACPR